MRKTLTACWPVQHDFGGRHFDPRRKRRGTDHILGGMGPGESFRNSPAVHEETGVKVTVRRRRGDFQTKTFAELNAHGDAYDMVVGDSVARGRSTGATMSTCRIS